MIKSEARTNDSGGLAIGDVCLHVIYPSIRETKLNRDLMEEIAKRWNEYVKLIKFLEKAEYVFNCAILRTPTGKVRNECTDLNNERFQFLAEAKKPTETKEEKSNEGP